MVFSLQNFRRGDTIDFFAFLTRIKPKLVEEKLSSIARTVSHEASGWLSNQASKLNLVPRALFFFFFSLTHQQEREGDGKGNILWGWPYIGRFDKLNCSKWAPKNT